MNLTIGTRFKIRYKDYLKLTFTVEKVTDDRAVICSAVDHKGKQMNFSTWIFTKTNIDWYESHGELTTLEDGVDALTFTDGEPVEVDENGMIRLVDDVAVSMMHRKNYLAQVEKNLELIGNGQPIAYDIGSMIDGGMQ